MPYKFKEIKNRLLKLGFVVIRQNGSHVLFSKGNLTFPVPKHGGQDISVGVENKIIKLIELSKTEFKNIR